MDTFLGRHKNLIVLAAILFAQIIALALQVRRPGQDGETRLIRLWAISAVTPIEKAVVHSQQSVHDLFFNYAYLRGVRKENRDLRAEIERMKLDDMRLNEDARMARRVQALLAFKEQYVEKTVAAQVIGTSGSEQSRVLYLDKGTNDGIKTDMAVITPGGIVGKVVQVFPDSSQVQPINDQFSGVGAALKSSRLQGILKGSSSGALTLQYIMSDEKVVPGEEVMTSGGDRIFPKGLPVGKVATVEPGKDLFLNIRVAPFVPIDQVEEVLVVTKIIDKGPDTSGLGPLRASDILSERLPGVPNKAEVDAAGNAKPAGGTAGAPAGGSASPTKPGATGTTTNKPATGTLLPGAKPAGSTPRGSVGAGTSPTGAGAVKATKPANGAAGNAPQKPVTGTGAEAPAAKPHRPPPVDPNTGLGEQTPPASRLTRPSSEPRPSHPEQTTPSDGGEPPPQ